MGVTASATGTSGQARVPAVENESFVHNTVHAEQFHPQDVENGDDWIESAGVCGAARVKLLAIRG
jgi:hypothetical protein